MVIVDKWVKVIGNNLTWFSRNTRGGINRLSIDYSRSPTKGLLTTTKRRFVGKAKHGGLTRKKKVK